MAQQQKQIAGPPRNLSGTLTPTSSSLQSSLSRDLTASRKKLIDQGLHSLLVNIVTDLKVTLKF